MSLEDAILELAKAVRAQTLLLSQQMPEPAALVETDKAVPVAQPVQTAAPAKAPSAKSVSKPVQKTEPEKPEPAKTDGYLAVKEATIKVKDKLGRDRAVALLAEFKVTNASQLAPNVYEQYIERAKDILLSENADQG